MCRLVDAWSINRSLVTKMSRGGSRDLVAEYVSRRLSTAEVPSRALAHCSRASLGVGLLALAAWAPFAALGLTVLGIDHRGLLHIQGAGDPTA